MQTQESLFDPTISEVDSGKYRENESEGEDDEAFFERLADMTVMLDAEPESVSQEDSDKHDGEASTESGGLRRSRQTIRAPQRLIEAIGVSMDETESHWKNCLVKVYEKVLVGAGIGIGSNHLSELNVVQYNKAMQSNDLEELTKWVKGMDEEHARFLFNKVWIVVLKSSYQDMIPITMMWALKLME
jgi:hypothetical protein